mmetsp:Transcript_13078/g.46501  ORF Transcript_13078/g.46501 Transcript_13078/m.46501 type:complete len:683 (+) Transcript_13078:34-2082(+)
MRSSGAPIALIAALIATSVFRCVEGTLFWDLVCAIKDCKARPPLGWVPETGFAPAAPLPTPGFVVAPLPTPGFSQGPGPSDAVIEAANAAAAAVAWHNNPKATPPSGPSPSFVTLPGTPQEGDVIREHEVLKVQPWEPADEDTGCTKRFQAPADAPNHATDLNGIRIPDVCLMDKLGPHHVFAIGDWGGVLLKNGGVVVPADDRSTTFKNHRTFVSGVDDCAQQNVAQAMAGRALASQPDYVLNVGDNFYWGGYATKCGAPPYQTNDASGQWKTVYEEMYRGPGLDGKQWLGVLGNHDYGGWMFTMGWDQAISYTWSTNLPTSTGRWFTPAQYYSGKVRYPDFAVEYFFLDNNMFDAFHPDEQPSNNICSSAHNLEYGATCGATGPTSPEDCFAWFARLWEAEKTWLDDSLDRSTADWQVIVVHFPPEGSWGEVFFARLAQTYGIDLIVAGHRHRQSFRYDDGPLGPTGVLVTGGGGGITSEGVPDSAGNDDEYGFADLTLSKDEIMVEMISHKGRIRSRKCITKRAPLQMKKAPFVGPSLCGDQVPAAPPPAPVAEAKTTMLATTTTTTPPPTPEAKAPAAPAAVQVLASRGGGHGTERLASGTGTTGEEFATASRPGFSANADYAAAQPTTGRPALPAESSEDGPVARRHASIAEANKGFRRLGSAGADAEVATEAALHV